MEGWLAEYVDAYRAGDRTWPSVAYALEKVCHEHAAQSWSTTGTVLARGDGPLFMFERVDEKLAELGVTLRFATRFAEPLVDRPIELPRQTGWPNAAFFGVECLRQHAVEIDAALRPIPPEIEIVRARLERDGHGVDRAGLARLLPLMAFDP